ncbi:MAG: hypothetical protein JWP92_2776 [Caulobacter sp.]|nr:hypothetical protein [Caulobacter sp.]
MRNTIKTAIALTATAAALAAGALAPQAASAQAYGGAYGQSGAYYDPCQRSTTNRSTGGGLAGAGIGAAIGSGVAANGARTEGAVLGGLLGAVLGANIGKSSAACTPGARTAYGDGAYNNAYAPPPPPPYDAQPYDARPYPTRDYDDRYAYDRRGRSYVVSEQRPDANGCTLAESPIYMPDGRTEKRFVRVCADSSGRYQVVD